MKIVEIREKTLPISSPIRNAYIDFSKMTLSLVAVVTDVIRDGKPVVGYGFNSNGRYGQGKLMRERKDDPREITQKYLGKLPQADQDALKKELETARLEHDKAIRGILTAEQQKTFDSRKAEMEKRRAERAEFEAWKAAKDKQAQ